METKLRNDMVGPSSAEPEDRCGEPDIVGCPELEERKNLPDQKLGMWRVHIAICALKISPGSLEVPRYHCCCVELLLSSK